MILHHQVGDTENRAVLLRTLSTCLQPYITKARHKATSVCPVDQLCLQCPGVNPLAMPHQMSAPVQHNQFPTVANKAHHLSFASPQTPDMQSLAESLFAGAASSHLHLIGTLFRQHKCLNILDAFLHAHTSVLPA